MREAGSLSPEGGNSAAGAHRFLGPPIGLGHLSPRAASMLQCIADTCNLPQRTGGAGDQQLTRTGDQSPTPCLTVTQAHGVTYILELPMGLG